MSQDFQPDSLEALTSHAFGLSAGQHEDLFPGLNLHNERDHRGMLLHPAPSSNSLYPFPDSTMTSDMYEVLWSSTDHSPTLSDGMSRMQDAQQQANEASSWPTPKSDGPEGARLSPTSDSLSTTTPDKMGKTVLTLENLDSDTRAEVVDLLCKRKIVTTIEMM